MIGTTLSRYQILEQIGAGGMGVVYRARDERLMRDVALKVLNAGLLSDEAARKRFRREALVLSQISHPSIAVLYDFDSHDGTDFLVMEFIPGATLDQRVSRGPIPESELVRLATQTAEALVAAHEQGVLHRDLKPANLIATPDGRVKVLDFGLARVLAPDAGLSVTLTDARSAAGTLAYMAPEVLGGAAADARSDVYSLGVVLYEMATGRAPFVDETALALMYAVLNRTAPSPRALNAAISGRLDAIILRAMDRDPQRRYGSARELLDDLRAAGGGEPRADSGATAAGQARIESIAVLPLENLSGDPAQEFFADGLTETLIAEIAKLGALRVISRTSVMRFKGVRKPLPEIARELRVDAVVEGSVIRSGDRVRVTAQLIDARSDTNLWAENYERSMSDILTLQSEVARAIAHEVNAKLSPRASERLGQSRRVNPEAFEAYLKGRYCWNRRGEDDMRRAIEYFQVAIEKDPGFALAYVGLADVYNLQGFYTSYPPAETYPKARALALKALELDPTLGEAHNSIAYVSYYYDWEWAAAERQFQRAIEMNPNHALAHQWYMNLLAGQGRFEEALRGSAKARALDPLSVITAALVGWVLIFMREYERAATEFRVPLEMDPSWVIGHLWSAWPRLQLGLQDEAIAGLEKAVALTGGTPYTRAHLAHGLAFVGRTDEARAALAALLELSSTRYVSPLYVALVHIALGEHDQAFAWLDRAVADRSHWLVHLDVDPRFDPIRDDPRFAAVRQKVGLGGGGSR
ncbi:MAG TPA: protein kinase [Candidatus Eisenbacteria bacterium]|nr:protein kinase [Candidatus Eisenbacteria bacterium]